MYRLCTLISAVDSVLNWLRLSDISISLLYLKFKSYPIYGGHWV